ncbi:unnamed protein product [Penicillium viridicatum]
MSSSIQLFERSFEAYRHQHATMHATLMPNADPVASGSAIIFPQYKPEDFLGYPVIRAMVHSEHPGYGSMYGWIQFVKCTSNDTCPSDNTTPTDVQDGCSDSHWQLDSVPLFDDLNTPFMYFGSNPTLFDAPTRIGKSNVNWRAQSYLTYIPDALVTRQVTPILGFTWGKWDQEHRFIGRAGTENVLERTHRGWTFDSAQ